MPDMLSNTILLPTNYQYTVPKSYQSLALDFPHNYASSAYTSF